MSILKIANDHYRIGNFKEALGFYHEASAIYGADLLKANIILCKKKLNLLNHTSSKGSVNIAYITDENYAMATYVSLCSLKKNVDKKRKYIVYVVGKFLSLKSQQAFTSLSDDLFYVIITSDKSCFKGLEINKPSFHVSTSALVKFNLPVILDNIDKLLYIDGDTIIQSDIAELYDLNIDDYYAGVIEDIKPKLVYKPDILTKLDIKDHERYFNSGVLLLNLKKMRIDDISEKLMDYRINGKNFFMDQDALNFIIGGKAKYLPIKYNFLTTLKESFDIKTINDHYPESKYKSYDNLLNDSLIIHYASKLKPWVNSRNEFTEKWFLEFARTNYNQYFYTRHPLEQFFFKDDLIVSLTSYPARIDTVHETVQSILNQEFKPKMVILWLAEEQFPDKEKMLPGKLLDLIGQGLVIDWYKDIRSYKKLIPALKKYPYKIIVTVDDDIIYKPSWLAELVGSYLQEPNSIHCCRAHHISVDENGFPPSYTKWKRNIKNSKSSFANFFTGCGGVLYPPGSLHSDVTNEEKFVELCSHGDDIWFWGMAVRNDTKIKIVSNNTFELNFIENSQDTALWKDNDIGGRNDLMIKNFFVNYPEVVNRLSE